MLQIFTKKSSLFVCFFIFSLGLLYFSWSFINVKGLDHFGLRPLTASLTFSNPEVQCNYLVDQSGFQFGSTELKTPSLESFIRASSTVESQGLRLSGLAIFSKLANACQPPVDVSKSRTQINKIALISLADEVVCPLQDLAVNAQQAGYSVVVYFSGSGPLNTTSDNGMQTDTRNVLLIPVLYSGSQCSRNINDSDLLKADRSNVEICAGKPSADYLQNMSRYLAKLYYWFLLGPIITLEWLRRTKKCCWMSGNQQVHDEERTNFLSVTEETLGNYGQEREHQPREGEQQPLIVVNDPRTNLTTTCLAIRRVTAFLGIIFHGSCYVILIVAALPVGISSGGWSFFRFDEGNEKIRQSTFWDHLLTTNPNQEAFLPGALLFLFLPLWWSPLQTFCFFLYSRFACKTTWTTPTQVSKLIRSDWFASNMYLFMLGIVVPCCSFNFDTAGYWYFFVYFTTYNTLCTICNLLFIIILNKHKFVTRYVFYISVCMICAYIESNIVAVFYFMLNSEGSLINLKLTALRTVAIGLTLTLSFSTSMHIIRKLAKPRESLFNGLSEK